MKSRSHFEDLSALLDGELDHERARFLLRRIGHDQALADTLVRWQQQGDVLRGEHVNVSPDFAERVAARIAAEDATAPMQSAERQMMPMTSAGALRKRPWRGFAAGALLASCAYVVFGWIWPQQQSASGVTASEQVAQHESAAALAAPATPPAMQLSKVILAEAKDAETRDAEPAVARVAQRPARSRIASATSDAQAAARARAASPLTDTPASAQQVAAVQENPGQLPRLMVDEPTSSQWPQPRLPGNGNPFNVSHRPDSIGNDPFRPHLSVDER